MFHRLLQRIGIGWVLMLICLPGVLQAQQGRRRGSDRDTTAPREVVRQIKRKQEPVDTLKLKQDSLALVRQQAVNDSLRRQSPLNSRIDFVAEDSLVFDISGGQMQLYRDSQMEFEGRKIKAERIGVNFEETVITANGIPDSTGELQNMPVLDESGNIYNTESIRFNYTTQRGSIVYTRTKQGEGFLTSSRTKREPEGFFYAANNRFTTCSHDPPHFYIRSGKTKVIPGEKIITGPFYMVIGDVPLPAVIPFGFFPSRFGRFSGVIFPTFGEDFNRGFNLRQGGYYWAPSPYYDLAFRGDIYTNGSWRAEITTRYDLRYRFQGGFTFEYAFNKFGQEGDPGYSEQTNFRVVWDHSQTIDPNTRFTASVNAGSSGFYTTSTRSIQDIFTNELNSSISFSKIFPRAGWSLTANLNHSQNTRTRIVNLTMPNLNISKTNRIQPFKRKVQLGLPRWYENISLSYSANLLNQTQISEANFFKQAMFDSLRYGMRHSVGLNTNLKLLKYITVTPNINYTEYWSGITSNTAFFSRPLVAGDLVVRRRGIDTLFAVADTNAGVLYGQTQTFDRRLATARDFSLGASLNTRIYGLVQTRWKNKAAFRHTIIPTLSYSFRPDFSDPFYGYYQEVQRSLTDTRPQRISRFAQSPIGGPGAGTQQLLSFRLQNLFQMKYLPQNDSAGREVAGEEKKFKYLNLLDDVSFGFSYNIAADSFRLSNISFSARTTLFGNKVNVLYSGTIDPYVFRNGRRVDELLASQRFSLGRLTNANLSLTTSFSAKGATAAPSALPATNPTGRADDLSGEMEALKRYRANYVDFNVPWNVSMGYNLNYSNSYRRGGEFTQSLSVSGEVRLTEKWRVGMQTGWDFQRRELTFTSINVMRDLHCWEFTFSAIPFGTYQSYNFEIRVKASMLQDLKLQKRRDWQDYVGGGRTARPFF